MEFSLRKMLSSITSFKKSTECPEKSPKQYVKMRRNTYVVDDSINDHLNSPELDSESRHCISLDLPHSVKNYAAKKSSSSDTDVIHSNTERPVREKRKKLKLDIKKARQSPNQLSYGDSSNLENTPKQVLLESNSSDERFKGFDFNKFYNLKDAMSEDQPSSPFEEENIDIESLSDHSDSDISTHSGKSPVKMCRKITKSESSDGRLAPSTSVESFADLEMDNNEIERIRLLMNYETKLEKVEGLLKKLLNDFQFHIEVSKVFQSQSLVKSLSGAHVSNISKQLNEIMQINNVNNEKKPSLTDSWNVIMETEDSDTKLKVKKHLLSMKGVIDEFMRMHLHNSDSNRNLTLGIKKCQRYVPKRANINHKKKIKYFDFPDLREAMINLFMIGDEIIPDNVDSSSSDESDISKCVCKCHHSLSSSSETDSATSSKTDERSMSITSSIGNFSLDSSTLTAYSESLDQIVSYNSFQDTSLYDVLLQKAAIDRITFYVQVHSIQLKCELIEEIEPKSVLTFYCLACKDTLTEENELLRHILSPVHCEKIHFLYKRAYIKKCVSTGKEIQPSTVLNSMTMYRDENKIVCFGDALYACSLCFENLIVGESVLMAHCCDQQHVDRRDRLADIVD